MRHGVLSQFLYQTSVKMRSEEEASPKRMSFSWLHCLLKMDRSDPLIVFLYPQVRERGSQQRYDLVTQPKQERSREGLSLVDAFWSTESTGSP